jgi:DNA-binding MarR family transcriptional regulator
MQTTSGCISPPDDKLVVITTIWLDRCARQRLNPADETTRLGHRFPDVACAARDVSKILATDKGWVSLSAESLRRRGYVSGSPDERDGRRILLSLTEEGRKMHDAILVVAQWRQQRLLASLPDGQADMLVECLDRLQAEADRLLEESEPPPRRKNAVASS